MQEVVVMATCDYQKRLECKFNNKLILFMLMILKEAIHYMQMKHVCYM